MGIIGKHGTCYGWFEVEIVVLQFLKDLVGQGCVAFAMLGVGFIGSWFSVDCDIVHIY
jgi:hypothetical protein